MTFEKSSSISEFLLQNLEQLNFMLSLHINLTGPK